MLHTLLHRTDLIIFPLVIVKPPDYRHCSDDVYLREGGAGFPRIEFGDNMLSVYWSAVTVDQVELSRVHTATQPTAPSGDVRFLAHCKRLLMV